jgi:hypothetical protein
MTRTTGALMLAALLATFGTLARPGSAQQQRWAAVDPNAEGSAQVVWAPTEAEARQRSVEACRRASKTCANGPASTSEMEDVFALMCCREPRQSCAISAAGSRQEALKNVQKTFADAGFSNCALRYYMSAATGRKQ